MLPPQATSLCGGGGGCRLCPGWETGLVLLTGSTMETQWLKRGIFIGGCLEVPTKVLGILPLSTIKPSCPPALPMPSSSIIWRDPMASGNAEQEEHAAPHDSHQRKPPCKHCRGYFKESEIKIETSPGELSPFTSFAAHLPCFPLDLPLSPATKDMPCGIQEPTHQT